MSGSLTTNITIVSLTDTIKEYTPAHHQFVADWNPEKFIFWASGISPEVKTYIDEMLSQNTYSETLYRACVGILSFAKK